MKRRMLYAIIMLLMLLQRAVHSEESFTYLDKVDLTDSLPMLGATGEDSKITWAVQRFEKDEGYYLYSFDFYDGTYSQFRIPLEDQEFVKLIDNDTDYRYVIWCRSKADEEGIIHIYGLDDEMKLHMLYTRDMKDCEYMESLFINDDALYYISEDGRYRMWKNGEDCAVDTEDNPSQRNDMNDQYYWLYTGGRHSADTFNFDGWYEIGIMTHTGENIKLVEISKYADRENDKVKDVGGITWKDDDCLLIFLSEKDDVYAFDNYELYEYSLSQRTLKPCTNKNGERICIYDGFGIGEEIALDRSGCWLVYVICSEEWSNTETIMVLSLDTGKTYRLFSSDEELCELIYPSIIQWTYDSRG